MKITPLKEAIKTRLQERYPGTDPDDFFTKWGAQPLSNTLKNSTKWILC